MKLTEEQKICLINMKVDLYTPFGILNEQGAEIMELKDLAEIREMVLSPVEKKRMGHPAFQILYIVGEKVQDYASRYDKTGLKTCLESVYDMRKFKIYYIPELKVFWRYGQYIHGGCPPMARYTKSVHALFNSPDIAHKIHQKLNLLKRSIKSISGIHVADAYSDFDLLYEYMNKKMVYNIHWNLNVDLCYYEYAIWDRMLELFMEEYLLQGGGD
jgi:hypothetical protein